MNYLGIAYFSTVLGSLNALNLAYFLRISSTDRQFWTVVNVQLLCLIVGYVVYFFMTAFCFFNREDSGEILDASSSVKVVYTISFFFIAVAESAYLYHSWMRAKTILLYKNKIWYVVLNTTLKISCAITFLPIPFHAVGLYLSSNDIVQMALLLTGFVGLIIFIFDCFILYSFSVYIFFSADKNVRSNRKNELIATYGTFASTAVLLTSFFQIAMISLPVSISFTNVLLLGVLFFFQVPTWTFVGLKIKLKVVPDTLDSKNTAPIESNI